jgi:uncharacterized protein (TIRG00374 family)
MKTWMRALVALLLCAALLLFVVDVKEVFATLGRCDPLWALVVLAALTADRLLMSYKWGLLLAIRNRHIGLKRQMMVYCSAMMWGLALPSTIGADGIRVVLARRFGIGVDDAVATIFVERGIGFICALSIALIGIGLLRAQVALEPIFDSLLILGSGMLAAAIGIVAFSFSKHALAWMRLLPFRAASSRIAQAIFRLHAAYRSLAADRERVVLFGSLTALEQVVMIACYGLTAVALGIEFDAAFLFAAVPLGILVSRLPISIDGIGVYEGIFMAIMTLGGVRPEDSLAISLAMRALQVIVWFPWWLMMAFEMKHLKPPQDEPLTAERPR